MKIQTTQNKLYSSDIFFHFRYQKPWDNGVSQVDGMNAFYDNEQFWYPTWAEEDESDNLAMKVCQNVL